MLTGLIMEMHQIRYFLAVARVLNFTHAAAECNVSQPALSRAIKQLEEELGGDLFRRERSLTHLTELGRMMVPLLTQAYETASSAKALASSYRKGNYAPLRLALSKTVDLRLLMEPLSSLLEALPGVELKFLRGDGEAVLNALKNGEFELAVAGPLPSDWERIRSWPLFNDTMRLVVNSDHSLASRNSITLSLLAGERMISRPYCEMTNQISALLSESGVHHLTSDAPASDEDVLTLVESKVGMAIMPSTVRSGEKLRSLPVDGLDITRQVQLYTVAGRQHSPAASGLIQLLRAANWKERISALAAGA